MRVSALGLSFAMLLSGCGAATALQPQGLPTMPAAGLSSAAVASGATASSVVPSPSGWDVYSAQYGGGDSEGMFWIDFYGPQPDYATHSVFVAFTDLGGDFSHAPFRYVTFDGQRIAPGTADFSALEAGLSQAYVPIGVDERIVKGAGTILSGAKAR